MSNFVFQLLEERNKLEKEKLILSGRLKGAPPGKLRISTCHGQSQYYYCSDTGNRNGKYIPKSQTNLVSMLSQKEYDKKVLSYIDSRLSHINKLLAIYDITDPKQYYLDMVQSKKKWITPVEPLWEDALKQWMEIPYTGLSFSPQDPIYYTNIKKQRIRSKSEQQLGNYFEERGILYKYECPLALPPYGIVYPDFTFLSPYTLQEIYLEHLGIMDDASYSSKTVNKIKGYEKNHIFPGERLILTYETGKNKLDMDIVEELVNKYLVLPDHIY